MYRLSLEEAKQRLRIPALWIHFGFPGEPKKSCRCPWRDDHKPSFSVSSDGMLWNDFGTHEGGDAIDFLARASGLSRADACRKFIELAGGGYVAPAARPPAPVQKARPSFPHFERGSAADLRQLAKLRNIGLEGLQFASERGLLWFATLRGLRAWIVTDGERVNAQARRMDGGLWEHLDGKPKAWTLLGSWAGWPIGAKESAPFKSIAFCEGGPDFLAAHYEALWEGASHYSKRDIACTPVVMLGSSLNMHADSLPLFEGKRIRIFCHSDEAGRAATKRWAAQLESVGADVDAFNFEGLRQVNGSPVTDLNESLAMDAASFREAERMLP
jgi:hypothetical protein